jgi:hypothetical protein
MAPQKELTQEEAKSTIEKAVDSTTGAVKDAYSYIADHVEEFYKDGKKLITNDKGEISWEKTKESASEGWSSAVKTIEDAEPALQDAGKKAGNFLSDNKGGLLGMLGAVLLGSFMGMDLLPMLLLVGAAFFGGSALIDKGNGMLGGLFGDKKDAAPAPGKTKEQEGPGASTGINEPAKTLEATVTPREDIIAISDKVAQMQVDQAEFFVGDKGMKPHLEMDKDLDKLVNTLKAAAVGKASKEDVSSAYQDAVKRFSDIKRAPGPEAQDYVTGIEQGLESIRPMIEQMPVKINMSAESPQPPMPPQTRQPTAQANSSVSLNVPAVDDPSGKGVVFAATYYLDKNGNPVASEKEADMVIRGTNLEKSKSFNVDEIGVRNAQTGEMEHFTLPKPTADSLAGKETLPGNSSLGGFALTTDNNRLNFADADNKMVLAQARAATQELSPDARGSYEPFTAPSQLSGGGVDFRKPGTNEAITGINTYYFNPADGFVANPGNATQAVRGYYREATALSASSTTGFTITAVGDARNNFDMTRLADSVEVPVKNHRMNMSDVVDAMEESKNTRERAINNRKEIEGQAADTSITALDPNMKKALAQALDPEHKVEVGGKGPLQAADPSQGKAV